MPEGHAGNVLTTYRSLRIAMIPLLLILLVAPALETLRVQTCFLGSISAYFHTPVRGAFVFALAGLGACLIAYKGNDPLEDVLLNFAGFMAFLVALVPTTVDPNCPTKYENVVADANTADAVRNNVLALVVISAIAIGLYVLMPRRVAAVRKRSGLPVETPVAPTSDDADRKASHLALILGWVAFAIVVAELVMFAGWPEIFRDVAHGISAITMVVGVLAVMVANARGFARATQGVDDPPARYWNNRYAVVALATLVLIVLALVLMYSRPHLILVLELIVIVGFVVFWLMQTRELWDYPTREQKSEKVDEVLEEVKREQEPVVETVDERALTPPPQGASPEPVPSPPPQPPPPNGPRPAEMPKSRNDVYQSL